MLPQDLQITVMKVIPRLEPHPKKNGRKETSTQLSSLEFLVVSQVNCSKTTREGLKVHYCYQKKLKSLS